MAGKMIQALNFIAEARKVRGFSDSVERRPGVDQPADLSVAALFDLRGRLVVITNVGGGGSREIAKLLASAGAHVVMADRVHESAEALAAEIRNDGGIAAAVDVDIEQEDAVNAFFAALGEAVGRVDILINCAGMSGHKSLADTSLALWNDIQSLNLRANFLCMREAVRLMVASGAGGRILNVTTIGGRHPAMHGAGAYGAARLGVSALGNAVAFDHAADGVLVNTLMIGAVPDRTLTHPTVAAELQAGRRTSGPILDAGRVPLGNGTLTDVAAAVLFLVSPASRYITGQSLVLDGGFLLT